jgi:hypothetical protein
MMIIFLTLYFLHSQVLKSISIAHQAKVSLLIQFNATNIMNVLIVKQRNIYALTVWFLTHQAHDTTDVINLIMLIAVTELNYVCFHK